VVALPTGPDRWTISRLVAEEWGWLPVANACDPPVGGHPAGIEGYKTIAFEICQELGWRSPDVVVVPVGYGDSIAGIHKGFKELSALGLVDRMPRLVAAEVHGSIARGLALGAEAPMAGVSLPSRAFSAATRLSTYQALKAVVESGGTAVVVDDAEIMAAHRRLAVREGIFVELSSAMPAAAAGKLAAAGELDAEDLVVLLATSGGLKDIDLTTTTDAIPMIQPELSSLQDTLRKRFGHVI
jgi:threonine synthase